MGWGYYVFHLSCLMFGVPGYQGSLSPEYGLIVRTGTGYPTSRAGNLFHGFPTEQTVNFSRVVAFRIGADGNVERVPTPPNANRIGNRTLREPCQVEQIKTPVDKPLPFLDASP